MIANKYATLRATIARAKRHDCQKVVMRMTLAEELLDQLSNAEKQIAELAVENAGLKELIEQHANSVAVCPNCSHEEPSETDDIVALYRSMETPATDTYLAEVRAQGVEMFAASLKVAGPHEHPYSVVANEFAAQLRKGVQS